MLCEQCLTLLLLLLVASILCQVTSTAIFYVTPTDSGYSLNNYTNTLQHYVDHKEKYFTTRYMKAEFHFYTGTHFLIRNLLIPRMFALTLNGNSSVIECDNKHVGISIVDVNRFTMKNIQIVHCGMKFTDIHSKNSDKTMQKWHTALFLRHCGSINIINVSITVNAGINGLIAVNNKMISNISNTVVQVKCSLNTFSLPDTNGMVLYNFHTQVIDNISYYISNYTYSPNILCSKISLQYALKVLLTQSRFNTYVKIFNTTFRNFYNAAVLNYHGESYTGNEQTVTNIVVFNNCTIINNTGNPLLKMFSFVVHGNGYCFGNEFEKSECKTHYNIIEFKHCDFTNNSNYEVLLHISPINTLSTNTKLKIKHCNICYNHMMMAIKITAKVKVLWQLSFFASIHSTNISFNMHTNGPNLIYATNTVIKLIRLVTIENNSYYYSIFMLRLSLLKFYGNIEVYENRVRHVFKGKEGSYFLVDAGSKIVITNNTVFNVMSQTATYDEHNQQVCYFQFINASRNGLKNNSRTFSFNYEIVMLNNIYTAPIHILNYSNIFLNNCSWLIGTAFTTYNSSEVYKRIVNRTLKGIDRKDIGIIPSSICHCDNSTEYNCTSHELGVIYPGQTILATLIIPRLTSIPQRSITLTVLNKNLPSHGCMVTEINQISQTHFDYTCNEYNYTIWSNEKSCELYLESTDSMETFYVDLQPCPLGFSLDVDEHACICDPVLNSNIVAVTSCNLNNATIQRPTNSWIFASKYNDTQLYKVSSQCPFDYCIPHTSYISLSSPDTQCQFKRSGVLCGHCQQGYSNVFGSSQCKQCSNVYLLIVVPIVIAGIALVIVLFVFNITINNGIMNTFIFYVNIISINFSVLFPQCNSIVCVLISLANLDLGIETCFYDGMNDFAKMWLQLTFPIYLFLIAYLLTISSRYSPRIQKLTAQKALPVLATLLLLSYTKILLTVCSVLFFYSKIFFLPSKHVKHVWSVDANINLFGVKFSILFTTCLILFIILLPFNVLLLFIRKLSHFKCINYFKPLLDVYCGPYKDKYYFWTGLYLFMRALFFGISAFDKKVSLTYGSILLGTLLCIQGIMRPFKNKAANIQESLILLNLLCIYVAANYSNYTDTGIELYIIHFLIIVVFIHFAISIVYRCLMSACGDSISKKLAWMTFIWKSSTKKDHHCNTPEINHASNDTAHHRYCEFQDPLIGLDTYN